jgi:hypothetical protein
MSGREADETTTGVPLSATMRSAPLTWQRNHPVCKCLLASLVLLVCMACVASNTKADVDTAGGLEPRSTSLKSSPREMSPLVTKSHDGEYKCSSEYAYSDFHDEAFGLVIGNCKAGTVFDVVDYGGPNSKGIYSYGGYAKGTLAACGWIESNTTPIKISATESTHCGDGSEVSTPESEFKAKVNGEGSKTEDGYPVVNQAACPEYANYRPWSSSNLEKDLIRTAPADASSGPGSNYPALKWRYTTKYDSTDGSGQYVMVRDDRITAAGEGNWVFVPRSCLPVTLPENENERIPPPPPPSASKNVFYVGSGGGISDLYVESGAWKTYGLGGSVREGTSPSAVDDPVSGFNVFYVGSDGAIWDWYIENGAWTDDRLGGSVRSGTSPSAIDSSNGRNVYYVGSEGEVWDWYVEGGVWKDYQIGGSVAVNTSPSAVYEPGGPNVFYLGSGGGITDLYVESGAWKTYGLGGSVRAGTSPSAVLESGSERNVFYVGSEGEIWDWYVEGGVWKDFGVGGSVAVNTSPSAVG